ncbi:FAD-dependent monooxygenase [Paraburkholderia sp. J67]|uniref:FAD-dependent monooxygenase n=1 Tax=Paraburkholderia sp. J67 TaxID=2805435 RepID=UPI002ABD9FA4|nr:FAD-dependent monooxygenase [Paraburkholderia sp. J67]
MPDNNVHHDELKLEKRIATKETLMSSGAEAKEFGNTVTYDARVVVAGAGPVGMCTAVELARRGHKVIVVESREQDTPPSAKCNTVASRTLEVFRRFGIADEVRAGGLPDDFPTDVVFCTAIAGSEMARIKMPSRAERNDTGFPDSHWRTPESQVRISQLYLEPILSSLVHRTPGITVVYGTSVESYQQIGDHVIISCRRSDGTGLTLRSDYFVGADGGRSTVRKVMGVRLVGAAELARTRTSLIRAPGLNTLWGSRRPAWMSWIANHKVRGNVVAIDGKDTWLVHRTLPNGISDYETLDLHQSIRDVLGVGEDFSFEILNHEDWVGRRMVAERLRDRKVFLAGDAAHLWVPFAGYGMNAGIADGVNLAWLLSNVLDGWAAPKMLDAFEAERHPITEQVSRLAMKSMLDMAETLGRNPVPAALSSRLNPVGIAMRSAIGTKLHDLNVPQFAPEGLNFGYYYSSSPIIQHDTDEAPTYSMGAVTESTVPGCRLPHFWLGKGHSLYDELGAVYTLLRFDRTVDISPLVAAAANSAMPLKVVDLQKSDDPVYQHKLLLVRQDQHVAWRGNAIPSNVEELIDLLCGRGKVDSDRALPHSSIFGKSRLGYVHIESNRIAEWRKFGADGLGMHVDSVDGGALAFRLDEHQRRIIVSPGDAEDVTALGIELGDERVLAEIRKRLSERGISVRSGTEDEARVRGVESFCTFDGPKRLKIDLYTRPVKSREELHMQSSGFRTGAAGIGHVAIVTREPESLQAFWETIFDARISDHIEDKVGGTVMDFTFLRLNERHHSVAVAATRGRRLDPTRNRIHHLNLQVATLDDVSAAYLRCRKLGYSIANAIGQHPNDLELSFYVVTPSGFEMELGWNPIVVDEASWRSTTHRGISLWGHFRENHSLGLTLKQMRRAIKSLKNKEYVVSVSK